MDAVEYDPANKATRWVAYFDFLGTSVRIKTGGLSPVFSAYKKAVDKLKAWQEPHPTVTSVWFSDTFLLYTNDESVQSFKAIEMLAHWFAFWLIYNRISVRGSLAHGEFYADARERVYLGGALLDAHDWGENQDWLGFVLAPSAVERLSALDLSVEKMRDYRYYEVPLKLRTCGTPRLQAACILGNWFRSEGRTNRLLLKLRTMKAKQTNPKIQRKYERTIEFLQQYER
jgi:hypothetical protein